MTIAKYFLLFLVFIYFSGFRTEHYNVHRSELTVKIEKEMQVGEEITYIVRYSFIKLGEVKLRINEKKSKNGKTIYKTKAFIDSYPGIPFVSLHQIYESDFNQNQYAEYFRATEKEKNYVKFTEYNFEYEKKRLKVKKGKFNPYQIWTDSTTSLNKYYQDGLSLFYYARMNTGISKKVNVPCFVTEAFENTKINFYDKVEPIKIDAVDYDIACVRLDGSTDFVSVYGLTGNFEGWFTNDKYAVPTIAKMKVIIGNVTLELKEWRKGKWTPPKYKD